MKILLTFANDRSGQFLRHVSEEHAELLSVYAEKNVQPVSLPAATSPRLVKALQQYRGEVCLLHYSGHANDHQLVFNSGLAPETADAASLAAFLALQPALKLVFLNGCSTQAQAQGLLKAGVAAVIATDTAIEDGAAREFAVTFYRGLLSGSSVNEAYHEASQATLMSREADIRKLYRDLGSQGGVSPSGLPWHLFPQEGSDWRLPLDELKTADQEQLQKNIIELRNTSHNRIVQDKGPSGSAKHNRLKIEGGGNNYVYQGVRDQEEEDEQT
jgi:CHAT domain-containing protein